MSGPKIIDPSKIFVQADCFYQALAVLCNVEPENMQLGVALIQPTVVIGALTIELFFKCLLCIETGKVPRTHDLRSLFERLTLTSRERILEGWEKIAARWAEWDRQEQALALRSPATFRPPWSLAAMRFSRFGTAMKAPLKGCNISCRIFPDFSAGSSWRSSRSGASFGRAVNHYRRLWRTKGKHEAP
jgi:hypothetical protein